MCLIRSFFWVCFVMLSFISFSFDVLFCVLFWFSWQYLLFFFHAMHAEHDIVLPIPSNGVHPCDWPMLVLRLLDLPSHLFDILLVASFLFFFALHYKNPVWNPFAWTLIHVNNCNVRPKLPTDSTSPGKSFFCDTDADVVANLLFTFCLTLNGAR